MARPYSYDLRQKAVEAVLNGAKLVEVSELQPIHELKDAENLISKVYLLRASGFTDVSLNHLKGCIF
ncbi:hypothetical protein [Synechococcus sp. C9]|jgi:hypothetical protein|uniref:hypothetical protein n=1 Tax=Synechococcus sp. C9 TaxID=102119 RepID=UPI001FF39215|nr:hypothetical protein [Synechococcus sp. C9]